MGRQRARALADAAITALYDAAETDGLWPRAIEAAAKPIGALGGGLYAMNEACEIEWMASHGFDPRILARYSGHYASRDWKLRKSLPNRLNAEGINVERPSWYDGSEIDVEIYAAVGVKYSTCVIVQSDDGLSWMLTHSMPRDRAPSDAADLRLYEAVATHAVRALRLDVVRRRAQVRSTSLASAIDGLDTAILLTSASGRIIEANAAAHAILDRRNGLRSIGGMLWADNSDARRDMAVIIGRCGTLAGGDGLPFAGGSLAVPRADGRPLLVRVVPLGLGSTTSSPRAATCMVIVKDPDLKRTVDPADLVQLFGLTPAESRVAALIGEGCAPDDIAMRLQMKRETVRTYLKRAMSKMDIHRQADLARMVSIASRTNVPAAKNASSRRVRTQDL